MTNVAGHSQLLPHCLSTVQMVTGNREGAQWIARLDFLSDYCVVRKVTCLLVFTPFLDQHFRQKGISKNF